VHWIAIKFDRDQEHITLCDSLAMKHDAIFKDLQILASKLGHSTPFKQIIKKVPNQENSFDCGPLSCLFMLLLAQDNSATDVPNDWQYNSKAVARLYRTRIFADIINQKLTTMHITKS
jgi:Ulp1 family protease